MPDLFSVVFAPPSHFAIFSGYGFLMLLYNSVRDLRSGLVDDRFNSLMTGVVLTLYAFSGVSGRILLNLIVTLVFIALYSKFGGVGKGDVLAFSWIFLGYLLWSPAYLMGFLWILALITVVASLGIRLLYKREKYPYYPFIFIAFWLMNSFISSIWLAS